MCWRSRRQKEPRPISRRERGWGGRGRRRARFGTGALVKAPKPAQDRRFDLPSIGPQTVEGAVRAGLAGIAVVAGSTIVAEPERLIESANRADIFVIGVPSRIE